MGKIEHSNSNKQCCVPQCKSRCTNEISLFRFPKEESQRKKWTDAIKIEKGNTQSMQVCSRHFVKNDYIISDIGGTKVKRLKRTAVPSQNLPWQFPNKRVSPTLAKARMERLMNRSQQKTSDSPVKFESPDQKANDVKTSEDIEKPENELKSEIIKADSSSDNLEDAEPKNEDMSVEDDDKATENKSVDVKDEKEDETEDEEEENGGEATEAKKDENNMTRTPTRLRQRKGLLKCEHCGRKCLTPQALQTHQQIAHKNARNNFINPKKESTKPKPLSPKPVALISVKSPESLQQNFAKKPLEKSLNTSQVEKMLQESDLGSDSDMSLKEEIVEQKNQRKTEFECPLCHRRFPVFFMANRHIQKHHSGPINGNKPLLPKPARIDICTICNITLEGNLHVCAGPLKLAMGFICTGCQQEYKTLTLFDMHKSSRHNDGVESMFFPSLDEFEVWKQRMQGQTRSKYTMLDQNDTKKTHRCTHRARLGAGSCGRQRLCPSSVVVQEFAKGFQVHYYPHHYGHAYEKYNLGKAFKKYSISSLMNRTASRLPDSDDDDHSDHDQPDHDHADADHDRGDTDHDHAGRADSDPADHAETDLYLQFQKIINELVTEAARINVNGLKKLMRKALDMIAIVNSYVEDEDDDVITSSIIKLDPDKDDLQDQVKKALLSLKRPGERVQVTPVKRRKSVFQSTENTLKTKEVVRSTRVKDEETENKFENKPLKLNQSPSFIDTFQDFVGKALVKPVEKKKRPSEKRTSTVKTKIGQFKTKSPLAKASLSPKSSLVKAASPKTPLLKAVPPKSPIVKALPPKSPLVKSLRPKSPLVKSLRPKSPLVKALPPKSPLVKAIPPKSPLVKALPPKSPLVKAVTPKSPFVKAVTPKSPLVKAGTPKSPLVKALSPKSSKTNIVSPRKSGVKDIQYEVKEQENDCNILILKI